MKLTIGLVALATLYSSAVLADDLTKIRCTFRAEGFKGGKSNVVSCSMSPQETFSSNGHRQDPADMCDQKPNAYQENFESYVADLAAHKVEYDGVLKISDFAKPGYIQSLVTDGKTKEQASAEAEKGASRHWSYDIDGVDHGTRLIYWGVGGQTHKPAKQMPTYLIKYDGKTLHYTVGVPEAVIVQVDGDEQHTWANMRFGLCQSE